MAPGLTDVLIRTQKNAGLGDIPINTWQTLDVFDTATQCKAGRQAIMDKIPNPGPQASDSLIARWAQLQASECIASDDHRLAPRKTRVNTGLRWSEQRRLEWRDVDFLTGLLTVRQSKSGHSRQIPMNSVVRSTLFDLASRRQDPENPAEIVFRCPYRQPDRFFPKAVERAQTALRDAGKDASRLDGYTWHGNRHTFASRLVMAGVDLRTI